MIYRLLQAISHPLAMPIYAQLIFIELERQSYSMSVSIALSASGMLIIGTLYCLWMISYIEKKNGGERHSLTNPQTTTNRRIYTAALITIVYIGYEFGAYYWEVNSWGHRVLIPIFIIPIWVNIIKTKVCIAPGATVGALTAYTINLGYRNSIDTFWPFATSIFLFALVTYCRSEEANEPLTPHLIYYILGGIQSTAIMYFL